jgi:hypothetical protein
MTLAEVRSGDLVILCQSDKPETTVAVMSNVGGLVRVAPGRAYLAATGHCADRRSQATIRVGTVEEIRRLSVARSNK